MFCNNNTEGVYILGKSSKSVKEILSTRGTRTGEVKEAS